MATVVVCLLPSRLRSGSRRRLRAGVAVLTALGALVLAAPASANVSHVFGGTFGSSSSSPVNPYPVSNPTDVEVDQTTHEIYVADPANHRVEKFDSSGHFILMFGKDVDQSTGANVCTAASGRHLPAGNDWNDPRCIHDAHLSGGRQLG